MRGSLGVAVGVVGLVGVAFTVTTGSLRAQEGEVPGKEVYDRWCAGCHGVDGAGEGPGAAWMLPRPRDFTRARYQIRTTGPGELPTDEDILRIIDEGMPGTAMPGWEDQLSEADRQDLVEYLKSLSRFFESMPAPEPLDFGSAPSASEERIAEGADVYQQLECWKCHGQAGRGDGSSSPTLDTDAGFPIYAADLTENWHFNGGGTVEEIYKRLRTGLDGTPMPTFQDAVDAGVITDDQLWSLAHYVRSLAPEERPESREVVVAELLEEAELPTGPADEAWSVADRFYVPMVAQIILSPRWFSPRVDGLWVQALHDGEELALRVSWTDPSASPDSAWADFAASIREIMEPDEGGSWAPGAPDRLVVQFPQSLTEGRERPYFLQGDARRPAYLWVWESDRSGAREQVARGMGSASDQPGGSQQVEAAAEHADGQWAVVFRRSLSTPDSADDLQIPRALSVPMAFQVWDGDNGESGFQGAVSSWYFINLREATPATVFVAPVLAFLLTGVLGMIVVVRAQRRERENTESETSP